MKKILLAVATLLSIGSAATFTDAGSMEAGGRFAFASIHQNIPTVKERNFNIEFMPVFNLYVADQFYIAALVNAEAQRGGGFLGIGGGVGYTFMPESPICPYVEGGFQFIHSGWVDRAGLGMPINGGIKIPVYDHALINLTATVYTKFINDAPGADFGLSGGVTIPIF